MKKSSLLAISLASLVALVGCGKQEAKKSTSRKTIESLFSFFYEGEFKVKKAKEAMTPVLDGQGYIWDYENGDDEQYYLIEGYEDSYIALLPAVNLYAGETEGSYVAHFSDGDIPVPDYKTAVKYSTNICANTLLGEDSMFAGEEWGYVKYWNKAIKTDDDDNPTMNAFDLTNVAEDDDGNLITKNKVYVMWASYIYTYEYEQAPTAEDPVALMVSELLVYNAAEVFEA